MPCEVLDTTDFGLYEEERFTVGLSASADDIESAKTTPLIDGFLEYNTVAITFGESGSGKSIFILNLCVFLLENTIIERVNYYDFDNGKAEQKNRGIHLLMRQYGNRFNYVNLDSMDEADLTPPQVLEGLTGAIANKSMPYSNQYFVFDTMGELAEGSLSKDEIMRPLLDKFKKLRSMGATVQTIHHTTKSKEDVSFFGSNYIKIKIDALWHLTTKESTDKGTMEFALKNVKNRSGNLRDYAFIVNPALHTLEIGDFIISSMSDIEADIVSQIRAVLGEDDYVQMKQSDLLEAIGRDGKDNKGIEVLKKYTGKFWGVRKEDKFPFTATYSKILG